MTSLHKHFWAATEPDALVRTWESEALKSETRGRDGLSPQQIAKNPLPLAEKCSTQLREGNYRFIAYKQVLKTRGHKRPPRTIAVPAARDRAPLKALLSFLHSSVPSSRSTLAQDKVSAVATALATGSYRHFIRIDIQDFYPSIDHAALEASIETHVPVAEARTALLAAVRTPTLGDVGKSEHVTSAKGVPQGLPISNALAEMLLSDLDAVYKADPAIEYFRYVDDILILTKRPMHRKIFSAVAKSLHEKGLECHPLKSNDSKSTWGPTSVPIDYLGYALSSGRISVREETVSRLKGRLAHRFVTFKKVLKNRPHFKEPEPWEQECIDRFLWFLNISITGCILDGRRRGWIHYFSQINDFGLLRELDHFVRSKFMREKMSVPDDLKSFITSYRKAVRVSNSNSGYVPNFDKYSSDEQADLLRRIFRVPQVELDALSTQEKAILFYRKLRKELASLETDLSFS